MLGTSDAEVNKLAVVLTLQSEIAGYKQEVK